MVVIGSGYIGIEVVEVFVKVGKKVIVIDILDCLLGVYLDKEFIDVLIEEMEVNNIIIVIGEIVECYEGDGCV